MSNETKSLAIVPKTIGEIQTLAEMMSKSALLPDALKGKVADIAVQILAGSELGLAPMASIRGVFVVQGKPTLSADTMVGLILGSGLAEYFMQIEATATSVTFEAKRRGAPAAQRCTWTMEDAKRAGLNTKDTWRLYPRQMLASRAKAELARSAFPDILAGTYDPDELPSTAPAPVPIVQRDLKPANSDATDAEIVSETTITEAEALATIAETTDVAALKALSATFATMPAESRATVRAAYDARKAELTKPAESAA